MVLLISVSSKDVAKGKTEYYQVIEYFEKNQVTEYELNIGTGSLKYKLKDGTTSKYTVPNVDLFVRDVHEGVVEHNKENPKEIIKYNYVSGASYNFWLQLIPIGLSVVCLLIVGFIFMKRMNNSISGENNRAMSFGKARVKFGKDEKRKTTFKQVAGADEEKEELQEIVEFLRDPQKFTELGARIPKGVLLVGPPGTGKTLLARAVAGEADVPFFSISGSDFVEMYVGVGASRVRDLFDQAKKSSPAIIFIDEIDAVGRHRGAGMGGGHDEREQTLNQLLVEMDGFGNNEGIIIIAATNRPDILDPALLRPGRFDRQVTVGRPDLKGREEILKVHARNKLFMSEEEKERIIKTLARKTSGMSGATLENILNEAAIICASKSVLDIGFTPVSEEADENGNPIVKEGEFVELSKCELTEEFKQMLNETFENSEELRKYAREDGFCVITEENIDEAFIKVILGISKHDKETPYKVKELTAYHEAGHAIIGRIKTPEKKVLQVSIVPRGSAGGYTLFEDAEEMHYTTKEDFYNEILVDFGGRAAEHYKYSTISVGASADLNSANKMAHSMIYNYAMGNESQLVRIYGENDYNTQLESKMFAFMEDILSKAYKEAYDLLVANSALLDELSQALIEKSTLNSEEVEDIFKKYLS